MPTTPASQRPKTMPLTGTFRATEVQLSLPAFAALQLSVTHLGRAYRQRPTASAVCRVALVDYVKRLEQLTEPEKAREAVRVLTASKAARSDAGAVIQAVAALEASREGLPLPTLAEVLSGPSGVPDAAALEAGVNAMLKAAHPRKFKDLA